MLYKRVQLNHWVEAALKSNGKRCMRFDWGDGPEGGRWQISDAGEWWTRILRIFHSIVTMPLISQMKNHLHCYRTKRWNINLTAILLLNLFISWFGTITMKNTTLRSSPIYPLQLSTACNGTPTVKSNIPYHCHAGEEHAQCCRRVRRGVCGMGERSERQCVALSWHFSVPALCVRIINANIRPFILFHKWNFHRLRQKSWYLV